MAKAHDSIRPGEVAIDLPGGFDAGIHGVLELAGICGRWRRPPYYSLSDAELEKLETELRNKGIL